MGVISFSWKDAFYAGFVGWLFYSVVQTCKGHSGRGRGMEQEWHWGDKGWLGSACSNAKPLMWTSSLGTL